MYRNSNLILLLLYCTATNIAILVKSGNTWSENKRGRETEGEGGGGVREGREGEKLE